ncbi:hypothetical protein A1O3_03138 [Capronia epimyces CBS 606.96]|uniref:Isopenicillin N synthase-like Fe(2+) 2OG dioxygenase domain-containing protein n=1 Tax=Capronia epimyces CBS 606.96 TaxID=1182542 RepID=W9YK59_9EURO|nr:uncharacterized protein A1O3_03138 [Capronia epimyces CBS 606.96]EXJ90070.1 hypothetical protein A1O3_03138 [Capronia epimyces CBS 606.96]
MALNGKTAANPLRSPRLRLDSGRFTRGSEQDRKDVAAQIDQSLREFTYCQVQLEPDTLRGILPNWKIQSRKLFDLEESVKSLLSPTSKHSLGYSALGTDKVRGEIPILNESYTCDAGPRTNWPDENLLPGFRGFATHLHMVLSDVLCDLIDCLSITMDLPPGQHLSQSHDCSDFRLGFLHYPSIASEAIPFGPGPGPGPGIQRNPTHIDSGTLTLLLSDGSGGLEVADRRETVETRSSWFDKHGLFAPVDPQDDLVTVLTGNRLKKISGARWKPTVHRVVAIYPTTSPAEESTATHAEMPERYSVALFSSSKAKATTAHADSRDRTIPPSSSS